MGAKEKRYIESTIQEKQKEIQTYFKEQIRTEKYDYNTLYEILYDWYYHFKVEDTKLTSRGIYNELEKTKYIDEYLSETPLEKAKMMLVSDEETLYSEYTTTEIIGIILDYKIRKSITTEIYQTVYEMGLEILESEGLMEKNVDTTKFLYYCRALSQYPIHDLEIQLEKETVIQLFTQKHGEHETEVDQEAIDEVKDILEKYGYDITNWSFLYNFELENLMSILYTNRVIDIKNKIRENVSKFEKEETEKIGAKK